MEKKLATQYFPVWARNSCTFLCAAHSASGMGGFYFKWLPRFALAHVALFLPELLKLGLIEDLDITSLQDHHLQ